VFEELLITLEQSYKLVTCLAVLWGSKMYLPCHKRAGKRTFAGIFYEYIIRNLPGKGRSVYFDTMVFILSLYTGACLGKQLVEL
jgi:hypothetical protein